MKGGGSFAKKLAISFTRGQMKLGQTRTRLKGTRSCTVILKGLLLTHKPGLSYYAETCEHFCFSPTVQKPRFQRLVGNKQTFAGALSVPQPLVCTITRGVTGVGHRETIEERAEEAEKA